MKLTVLSIILINFGLLSGQTGNDKTNLIPDDLNSLFQKSCLMCHSNKGEILSRSLLNFDRWKDYSESKRIEKAGLICKMVTKGDMPPKTIRDSKPELIPTKEQVEQICKWSESLKASGKK